METYACALSKIYTFGADASRGKFQHQPPRRVQDAGPEVAFADLKTALRLAEAMLKYVFKGRRFWEERADDMKFFAEPRG